MTFSVNSSETNEANGFRSLEYIPYVGSLHLLCLCCFYCVRIESVLCLVNRKSGFCKSLDFPQTAEMQRVHSFGWELTL